MEDLKSGIEHLKQAKAHMSKANNIMSDSISKLRELEEENAELKAELDDWKGNAEGFQPDAYMRLPLDADGVPIRIGDKMDVDGDCMTMLGYRKYNGTLHLIVKKMESSITFTLDPSSIHHFKYAPPDSWEKLEEDAAKEVCAYAGAPFSIVDQDRYSCTGCRFDDCSSRKTSCWLQMNSELMARAKKLAGIEEEAQR